MSGLPSAARAIIVGGGIAGCSIAYHLAKLGWKDVVLLEQGRLSGGTTWHAAGLVGQLRTHPSMTSLIRYSTSLYAGLEAETGLSTGWKQCGSLTVARTPERMTLLKRVAASARVQGVECALLTPDQAGEKWPHMRVDDLVGAIWLPGDGKANPADITQALAKGARQRGAAVFEKTRVNEILTRDGRAVGVRVGDQQISAEIVVLACGQWTRQIAASVGVPVPLHSCEHMYIVTGLIPGVERDLPVMRDPDGYIYFKEEVGGLLMGGFEPKAKPWLTDVPEDFEFGMLPDDWDQFDILMQNALHRVPALEKAEIKTFMNGPESFTADNNYILGEAAQLHGLYVAAGFNSMGIASAGGAGRALAEWIVEGQPTIDLWPVDIRRFAPFHGNTNWLKSRVSEVLGLHYEMPWPRREMQTGRPQRRSPLYDRLAAKGAVFGSKMGWERPNVFAPAGEKRELTYGWGRANWFPWHLAEQQAVRERLGIFDQMSFGKLLIQGAGAEAALQRLAANDIAVPVGRSVYTGLLNHRGGYESDVTIMRLAADQFLLLTGTAQIERDADWIRRNLVPGEAVAVTDVTAASSILTVAGREAAALLTRVGTNAERLAGLKTGDFAPVDVGVASAIACRRAYTGGPGFELLIGTEFAAAAYDSLMEAGAEFGLMDCGYYALDALRIEAGFKAWGAELTPDITPWQAGLGFAVKLDKPHDFIGRAALEKEKSKPLGIRILALVAERADAPVVHGGELVLQNGRRVGEVTSAGFSWKLDRPVMLAKFTLEEGVVDEAFLAKGGFTIDVGGDEVAVTVSK